MFLAACSSPEAPTTDTEEPERPVTAITLEEIVGVYKSVDYTVAIGSAAPQTDTEQIDKFWVITTHTLSIDRAEERTFTYADNTITCDAVAYTVTKDGKMLILTSTNAGKTIVIRLEPTTDDPNINPDDPNDPDDPKDPPVGSVELDKLYGYATLEGGTTGGAAATSANIHHFNDGDKFRLWLNQREKEKSTTPATVYLSGTFTKENGRASSSPWFDVKRTSNITIIGIDGFRMQNVGLFLVEAENIVIRNLYILMPKADNGADGISMQECKHVWVDHCTFESVNQSYDYEDGSCDITHQCQFVTVSWCHYIKTQKSTLIGHSNSASADEVITVTMHHNFFDLSSSRHPRVRFGRAHVYNNFYNQVTTYGVGSAYGARVLVESNSFRGVRLPTDICTFPAKPSGSSWVSNLTGSVAGYLFERNNLFADKPSDAPDPYPFTNVEYKSYNGDRLSTPLTFDDFNPPYDYLLDEQQRLEEIVPAGAGAGHLAGYDKAPVEVNNGNISDSGSGDDPGTGSDQPSTTDVGGGWTMVSIGDSGASFNLSGGAITLTGKGKFESGAQTFAYVYRKLSGNFTVTVRLDSYTTASTSNQSEAGVLLTDNAASSGTAFIHALCGRGGNGYNYSHRLSSGANASRGALASITGDGAVYLRLERSGQSYTASYSLDSGQTYSTPKSNTFTASLPEELYVGLVVNSGSNSASATATFSDLRIDGTLVPFGDD